MLSTRWTILKPIFIFFENFQLLVVAQDLSFAAYEKSETISPHYFVSSMSNFERVTRFSDFQNLLAFVNNCTITSITRTTNTSVGKRTRDDFKLLFCSIFDIRLQTLQDYGNFS